MDVSTVKSLMEIGPTSLTIVGLFWLLILSERVKKMASGRSKVVITVVKTFGNDHFIIKVPDEMKDAFDGCFCEDNGFRNLGIIPNNAGVYELTCEHVWDDGDNGFIERTDPEWDFNVLSVKLLFKI